MDQSSYREKKKLELTFPFLSWEIDTRSFPLHWHDCFEIMVISKGGMYVFINDSIFEASVGDMVMINAGAIHGFFDSHPGTIIEGLQFDITLFDESFINLRDILFQNPILGKNIKKEECYARLRRLFDEMLHEDTEKIIGYQLAVKAKLYEFMLTILREIPKQYSKTSSSKSKRILALVFKNADDPDFTLEEAAETLKLNKFYFSHLFKRYTGQSFHSYLVQTRITFAKHYLMESKMSITDIAFHSGFNSIQTFNRVFKSLTGFTPRDYRCEIAFSPSISTMCFPTRIGESNK
ncbi:MAG: AraC family transcriptional regulator [Spirochaetaceae bacterium]|jgi:AraC-like DNA-binding protein|nr:AraC family transcriptional regulator [Spirochaetaceae bacterium]